MKRTLSTLALLAMLPTLAPAQSLSVGASRWLTSPGISEYRLGMDGYRTGPLIFRPGVQLARRGGESDAAWGGIGSDAILRLSRDARPYLIGGAGLGLARPDSLGGLGPALGFWGGVGAELVNLGPVGFQAEALYTWRGRMSARSISLGIRAGMKIGGPRTREAPGTIQRTDGMTLPRVNPADEDVIRRAGRPVEGAVTPARRERRGHRDVRHGNSLPVGRLGRERVRLLRADPVRLRATRDRAAPPERGAGPCGL